MKELITLCGDNCTACPRYTSKSEEDLKKTAQLWYKVGWRDSIVSNEEIKCEGCSSHKVCTYELVECIKVQGVTKCNECNQFPCDKIENMLERTKKYQINCKNICTNEEYEVLNKAFFEKEKNLKEQK